MKMQLGLKTEIFFCRNDHLQMVILAKIISVSFVGGFISVCTMKEVFLLLFCFKFEVLSLQSCWFALQCFTSQEQKKVSS